MIHKHYLSETINNIKNNNIDLKSYLFDICENIEKNDTKIKSFLSEPSKFDRLIFELSQKDKNQPFYGIPIGIKDLFVVDGFETKCGSFLPSELFLGEEAEIVKLLKSKGFLIAGKTVTTEFAFSEPNETVNPHNINYSPGGSSSGSAAAVSFGFIPVAIGTQTIGSISRPASYCGVIGFKPTYGKISTKGVIPFSPSVDTIGFFTQDIDGMIFLIKNIFENYSESSNLKQPTIGIPVGSYLAQTSKNIKENFYSNVEKLKQKGYLIKEVDLFGDIDLINKNHRIIIAKEFSNVHKNWAELHFEKYREGSQNLIIEGTKLSIDDLNNSLKEKNILQKKYEDISDLHNIDIWISPSTTTLPPEFLMKSTGSPLMNLPWTNLRVPTITIPCGTNENNLPFGLQIAGKYNKDEILLEYSKKISEDL